MPPLLTNTTTTPSSSSVSSSSSPSRTLSESDLQDLLFLHSNNLNDKEVNQSLPLFQDFQNPGEGFEALYAPSSPTASSTDSPTSHYDDFKHQLQLQQQQVMLNASEFNFINSSIEPTAAVVKDNYVLGYSSAYNHEIYSHRAVDTTPIPPTVKEETHLQIRILGVPPTGAKSRVETQIKLCIQLMTQDDKKVMDWSYIRLSENMLARSRLRKNQQQLQSKVDGGSVGVATMVSDESKVLQLEAKVVCASNTDHPIRMCVGCVRRERKRAERTKVGKQKSAVEVMLTSQELEAERDRILLFNCSPMMNFSSGDAILPTRITCYCRHHNEKLGFRICFVMKNDKGEIVGKGISPPIMITDDHKSSKQQQQKNTTGTTTTTKYRKRSREEDNGNEIISRPDTPANSRRGSISTDDSPLSMTCSSGRRDTIFSLSSSSSLQQQQQDLLLTPLQTPSASTTDEPEESITPTSLEFINHQLSMNNDFFSQQQSQQQTDLLFDSTTTTPSTSTSTEAWPFNRRRRISNRGAYTSSDNLTSLLLDSLINSSSVSPTTSASTSVTPTPHSPQLDRLVPAQGPTYGGVEVTLLGSGFYRGLTCLFGEHAATTVYWNSSTIVCILPTAAQTGPVVVSFREHPLVLESQDVAIFTYYDASDQALLELALQVVGLKMTGKLHDAKSVAMRIVQGDQQQQNQQQQSNNGSQGQQQHATNIQQDLIDALENTTSPLDLFLVNTSGQSLLHLAVLLGNELLVKSLISACPSENKLKFLNMQDKHEMTVLAFAVYQTKSLDMVRLLLSFGANPASVLSGTTSYQQTEIDGSILDLLDLYKKRNPLSRRSSGVKSHMMHRFHSLSNTSTTAESTVLDSSSGEKIKSPSMESDGLGLVRQKIDRRLYLFWLPVLILAIGLLGVQWIGKQPSSIFKPFVEMLPTRHHTISLTSSSSA